MGRFGACLRLLWKYCAQDPLRLALLLPELPGAKPDQVSHSLRAFQSPSAALLLNQRRRLNINEGKLRASRRFQSRNSTCYALDLGFKGGSFP